MDDPPSNYNPNESVLAGGINSSTPINMVQGGGGGDALNGYNETASVLEGGITNANAPITQVQGGGGILDNYNETASVLEGGITNTNAPITQVQGGGGDNNIQIVTHYNMLDEKQYEAFIQKFSSTGRFKPAADRLEELFKKKYSEKVLHYRKAGTYVESNSLNSRNSTNLIQIKFVPPTTKTLIILPPVTNPKEFINQLMFLVANKYLTIDSKRNLILERNIFVISLAAFDNSDTSRYFYYKLKLSNLYSYYRIDDPFVFIVRKELENKKGILISKSEFKFLEPMKPDDLAPVDYDLINEDNINTMKYKGDPSKEYNNFYTISDGNDPDSTIVNDYSFTLKTHIAVLELIDEDIQKILVNIQGKSYRIRVPFTPNETLDKVYAAWKHKKYIGDETKLIHELGLEHIEGLDIPRFLFHLSYFKCFDDVSLLTKKECTYMKQELQKVYLHSLKKRESKINRISETSSTGEYDNRIIESYDCDAIDLSTDNEKVVCEVLYKEGLEKNETTVTIDKKFISLLNSTNKEDIEKISEAVETEFRKSK